MLRVVEKVPDGLLAAEPEELAALLGGPTLMHLPGKREAPLFVSVLLHGNEQVGYHAIRAILQRFDGCKLPRALSVFFGNVDAAAAGVRRLDGQVDYNRVWPAGGDGSSPEHGMMRQITEEMRRRHPFASVDIHGNTGVNPHYACVNRTDNNFLSLASLFSRTVVYFLRPSAVQSMTFAQICPSVTVECGKVGSRHGVEHAIEFLDACLHLSGLSDDPVHAQDVDVYHTVATVRVSERCDLSVGQGDGDIILIDDIDHLNFREVPAGTRLARMTGDEGICLEVIDESGSEVGDRYFERVGDELRTRRAVMPSMFTADARIIRQDCLGYLMERYPLPV